MTSRQGSDPTGYRQQATFLRAALLLGLVPGEAAIRWAEAILHENPNPPAPLVDVVMIPPGDLTSLRFALQPLADPAETPAITRAILALVRRDFTTRRRELVDTVTVLGQIRRHVLVSDTIKGELDTLEDDFMLAKTGVTGTVETSRARVAEWLEQFADADRSIGAGWL